MDVPTADVHAVALTVSFVRITKQECDFPVEDTNPEPHDVASLVRSIALQHLTQAMQQAGFSVQVTGIDIEDADLY